MDFMSSLWSLFTCCYRAQAQEQQQAVVLHQRELPSTGGSSGDTYARQKSLDAARTSALETKPMPRQSTSETSNPDEPYSTNSNNSNKRFVGFRMKPQKSNLSDLSAKTQSTFHNLPW